MKIVSIRSISVLAICLVVVWSCNSCGNWFSKGKVVSLRLDGYRNSITGARFAGEVIGRKDFARKWGLDLKLEPGGNKTPDPVTAVTSGLNDFGIIAADKFLEANEKGADLVAVGVVNELTPTRFVSLARTKIRTPKDWIGKRIGVIPGDPSENVYRSLLKKEGLSPTQFTEVVLPPGDYIYAMYALQVGEYDVYPATIFFELENLQYLYDSHRTIVPLDYDVVYVGRVYFARREFVRSNPETVQAFVNTMADGWKWAIYDCKRAADRLKEFTPKMFESEICISLGVGFGYTPYSVPWGLEFQYPDWDQTVAELIGIGAIKNPEYRHYIDDSFITNYSAIPSE